ncbi:MAG TPA: hypothetical protein VFU02_12235 [Polyangiaceae bacterium]|nr:hypothetical protein [Polyangiaceae bacterium]
MLAIAVCLLVLIAAWFVLRSRRLAPAPARHPSYLPGAHDRWDIACGAGCLALACSPLVFMAPWLWGEPRVFWGDTATHADVAFDIARSGLPHGWLDSTLGGFPFAHHYPPVPWLVLAAAIRLGLEPVAAIQLIGWGATLALPFAFYAAALATGARPHFACLGATCLTWVSPYNAFIGGYETFFSQGLFAQVVAMPVCVWFAASIVAGRNVWSPALSAGLLMACHPQITVSTVLLLGIVVLAAGKRVLLARYAWGSAVASCAGAALYGQGIRSLVIPFGWPPGFGWRQLGFSPSRLSFWFVDAELLDQERAPVLTALLAAAVLVLLLHLGRSEARAALAGCGGAVLLSVSGEGLASLGSVGTALLSFLQPLRVAALIPIAVASVMVVALETAAPPLARAFHARGSPRVAGFAAWGLCLAALIIAIAALPSRVAYALARPPNARAAPCPSGYHTATMRQWLAELSRGRVWYDAASTAPLSQCFTRDGLALASGVPIANTDAVGAHVGLLQLAFERLEPRREGSARRAEALGVRSALVVGAPSAGWVERRRSGSVGLFEHERASDLVGLGCIARRYTGTDRVVRGRLVEELATARGADQLLDPASPVALELGGGAFQEVAESASSCSTQGATITARSPAPGELTARIEARHPVDAVLRVTAFPTWRVNVDEKPYPTRMVAPGFISVRLPPGSHHLHARVSLLPNSSWILLLTLLGVVGAAVPVSRWLRAPR